MNFLQQMPGEELANTLTHLIATIGALLGLIYFLRNSSKLPWGAFWGRIVFASTMLLLFLASTLYHAAPHGPTKELLRKIDHIAVYCFIGASHMGMLFAVPDIGIPKKMAFAMWAAVLIASTAKAFVIGNDVVFALVCFFMIWTLLIFVNFKCSVVGLILLGAALYTVGGVFCVLDESVPYFHLVWHLCSMAGSRTHYVALLKAGEHWQ